jgi:beta-N-acetylhexosaminidase
VALGAVAVAALGGGLAVGGSGGEERPAAVPEASGGGGPVDRPSFLARIVPPPAEHRRVGQGVPRTVADLVRRLLLERKVAQLFLVGFEGTDLTADVYVRLRRLDYGGIVLDRVNYTDAQVLGQMASEAGVIAGQERHVPPWVMAPQEGGERNAFPHLPPADAPADIPSASVAGREAAEAGASLKALGINGLVAPVIDVGSGDAPALGARVYSDDPREVAAFADATVAAYTRAGIMTAPGHFPGLGAADQSTEEGPAQVGLSVSELSRRDLVPFRAAFDAGAQAVLLSSALYSIDDFTVPASLSRNVATGLLRGRLRFPGMAITDDLADPAITTVASVPEAAVRAIRAGADMLWISGPERDQQAAYVAVLRAVQRGRISRARLNEAVGRILQAKRRFGLLRE